MPNKQLEDLGYSISSELVLDLYDGYTGNHFHKVTVSLNGRSMECEYTAGCAHRHMPGRPLVAPKNPLFGRFTAHDLEQNRKSVPNEPVLADVLYSLLADSSIGRNGESFSDFCADFGYDEDSRKAFNTYEACLEQYSKLCKLGVDFDALEAALEDY